MATSRTNRVEVEIVANDEASPKIDKLEKKIDGLESDEARIIVTANTERLETQLNTARDKLEQLDGDEASVQARLVGNLEADLADARRLFEQLDGQTGTVKINADTSDAKSKLDGLSASLEDLIGKAGGIPAALGAALGPAAIGGALAAAAASATQIGVEVGQIATVLETSTEEASRLRAVFADSGVEASDLADIALQVAGAFEATPQLVQRLGVELDDVRTPADALKVAIDAWDFLKATERSTLFGEEGVRQIGAIVAAGEDLDDLLAGVEQRRILSDEDVARSQEMAAMVSELKGHVEGLAVAVGGPLVQAVTDLDNAIREIPGLEEGLFAEIATGIEDIFTPGSHASDKTLRAWGLLGSEAGDVYIGIIERVGGAEPVVQRATDLIADLTTQQERYIATLEGRAGEADRVQDLVDAEERHFNAVRAVNDEHERTDERQQDLDDEAYKVAVLAAEYEELHEAISGERSLLRLQETLLRAEEQFAKGGLSLREARLVMLDAQEATLSYLETLEDIPPEKVTQIVTQLDYGQFDRVSNQLTTLGQPVDVPVRLSFAADTPNWVRALSQLNAEHEPRIGSVSGVAPNVTIINPPGTPAQIVGSGNVYYSRNGVRTDP